MKLSDFEYDDGDQSVFVVLIKVTVSINKGEDLAYPYLRKAARKKRKNSGGDKDPGGDKDAKRPKKEKASAEDKPVDKQPDPVENQPEAAQHATTQP